MVCMCVWCRFGEYRPNEPSSFTLADNMAFYPQFMFNLRRSQFVQVSFVDSVLPLLQYIILSIV